MTEQSVNAGNSFGHLETLSDIDWSHIRAARDGADLQIAEPWQSIFAPLLAPTTRASFVIGQIGQSLDGRIATASGHSHYINGPAAITHLHRLRALADAVVVGIGTVLADDPQLTVRRVEGPSPARVVIDPQGRMPRGAKLLAADGCRRIVVTRPRAAADLPGDVERLDIDDDAGVLAPAAIMRALTGLGLHRVLIEGGALTLSRFLAAGCLQRLHVVMAPLIIGSGPAGLSLPTIDRLEQALRPPMRAWRLDQDLLLDLDLGAGG
ncbi:riboflavin deaminase [Vineibacter terrae]|uniref:Riboflavin deaminase n=1 Tax=Vineibacter terrae TaxID=2586908 RepID=A0A5C8PA26_9HYPH|nr:dihydrofolate reductase family protein [Vineibacter terrae]TXL70077.1 riboflavin deaminase [Vineibacter terrae]